MDIALAVEEIYPDANFRRSDTYANLQKSWKDARRCPTEGELAEAWLRVLLNRALAVGVEEDEKAKRVLLSDKIEREKLSTAEQMSLLFDVVVMLLPEHE